MSAAPDPALQKEALRQQMLLRALWRDARPGVVGGWLRDGSRFQRGLEAYQANAGALAERALTAVYPTLQQLVGAASFAALARVFWRQAPPVRGDVGEWGEGLAAFIDGDEQLADEPYLADVARLEWLLHAAERAPDAAPAPCGLERLAEADPATLRLVLRPGTAVVASVHPIVAIWQAHRSHAEDRFAAVRAAFAAGVGETALVLRRGWKAEAQALPAAAASFTAAVLEGRSLAAALAAGGADFEFEPWLIDALAQGAIVAVKENPR
jgi:hypothetical protein